MNRIFPLATAAALITVASTASATTQLGKYLTFSGFGTFGVVQTDSSEGEYIREYEAKGANKNVSDLVDSNLGLQLTGKANSWLSATVQTLTAQRTRDHFSTQIEWAFVKVVPYRGVSLRAGQMSLPNFLVSDSRRVGYVNTPLRTANEVYGLDVLNGGLTGADLSYRLPILGNSLTMTVLAGESSITSANSDATKAKNLRGVNLVWDGDWYTLRLGQVTAEPAFASTNFIAALIPAGGVEQYKFTGLGFTVDRNNVVLQGEYVKRRSRFFTPQIGGNGWYVFGGYRFEKLLPYVSLSELKAVSGGSVAPQKTSALGLRWDAFSSADIKFQFEHVDTDGTAGISFVTPVTPSPFGPSTSAPVTRPVNTFSIALDFVF